MDASDSAAISVAAISALAGDILVIEVGCRDATTSTSRQGNIEIGDSLSDPEAPEDETSTIPKVPWIEFSQTITFQTSIPLLTWLNNSYEHATRFLRRPKRMIPSGKKLG
jgi:hypothetical protein